MSEQVRCGECGCKWWYMGTIGQHGFQMAQVPQCGQCGNTTVATEDDQ